MIIKAEELNKFKEFADKVEKARIDLDRLYSQRKAAIEQLYKEGHSVAEIARLFKMQYQNVSKICAPFR